MPAIDPPIAEAGVKVDIKPDEQFARTKLVASNRNFGNRRDAFALLPAEANFERNQRQEFVFQESGGFFGQEYELPEEPTAPTIVVEPQPLNRRMEYLLCWKWKMARPMRCSLELRFQEAHGTSSPLMVQSLY
jgi:hypothetical protein